MRGAVALAASVAPPDSGDVVISTATASSRKRPPEELVMSPAAHSVTYSSISTAATSGIATLFSSGTNVNMCSSFQGREFKQMRLTSVKVDPDAHKKLDIALSMLSHCLGHKFKLAKDPLMCRVIEVARTLPPGRYTPPDENRVAGELLDAVYDACMDENLDRLVDEADTFGLRRMVTWQLLGNMLVQIFLLLVSITPFPSKISLIAPNSASRGKPRTPNTLPGSSFHTVVLWSKGQRKVTAGEHPE